MRTLYLTLLLLTFSAAYANQFEEGVHYQVIADERTEDAQILEFFSFYCATCYRYQPFNQRLESEFDGTVSKYQVAFLSPPGMEQDMVKAWAAARILKVESAFSRELFKRHFEQRERTSSLHEVEDAFVSIGVEAEDFQHAFNGFQATTLSRRMQQQAERYEVRGTPTYILNGKYQMLPQAFRNSANFFDDYLQLATYLSTKN